ncbi:hypothetical protein PF010_g27596 [Phytophthora fragariae]|uniref:Uncharacterized protein n=1 Tax=Phytophthora fragariae TaxID=53985 RepID=A0A6A3RRW0_9STRA|nr:hypothetical protein PF003_g9851 [Phytophthora fragariae]KAE8968802.1 hypothetical protein PF011_g27047 [Phytophthora fragariae]KAE9067109.1 hypothetical protein PF010_g27596 [Phytophthora fragariae]KAE9102716.1 hypothetical protein PF006_g22349 [Phytophthora fragariae]KAE9192758.1 hypothetical protein PF002_g24104 [Phytophthora fragariae]
MTIPPVAPAPSQRTRVLRGGLVWSAVRGARLLRALTSNGDQEEQESQEDQEQNVDDQFSADFPYELELCVPTAGHLALVLVRRPPGIQLKSPARSSTTPVTPTGSASAPAAPRVVYVLDALPPSRRGGYEDKSRSRKNNTPGAQLPQQQVDELELLQELFAPHTRAAGGKEGSVLIKAPLLCARFDCRVVSIRFIRSGGSLHKSQKLSKSSSRGLNDSFNLGAASSSRAVGAAAPLRCIVAREDGMAFLWEWQADLFQWVFLNRLCFLENPNLKWTRPVAAFTTTDLPLDSSMLGLSGEAGGGSGNGNGSGSSGATELVWWSTATKQEPKLKLRRLRFERATDALRATDVVVGSAFTPKPACDDIVKLLSSKLGLFAISKTQGIFFRSSTASLRTVGLSWHSIVSLDEESAIPEIAQLMICVHSVTGELVVLHRASGEVFLVTPKSSGSSSSVSDKSRTRENESCTVLFSRKLTILTPWGQSCGGSVGDKDQGLDVLDVAAHRHVLLVLNQRIIRVYTLIDGELLEDVDLPDTIANSSQRSCGKYKFWTISGGASSIGLWSPNGFWTIRLPPAKTIAGALHQPPSSKQGRKCDGKEKNPKAAFLAVKDYGTGDLHLEAVRYALEVLEQVTPSAMDPTQSHPAAWEAVWNTVSSPALLLALLDNRATSEHVVHELAQHVAAIYNTASRIRSCGRLDGAGGSRKPDNHLLRLTPANLESLHHLANWIVLAKRKLARLEGSSGGNFVESSSVSFTEDPGNRQSRAESDLTTVLANEDDLTTAQDEQYIRRNDSIVDPEDARNFRLSRKLRPMSSLRFAAGCSTSSERQGQQWLLQLESFLLDGVAFKEQTQQGGSRRVVRAEATPSHRLFHSERVLADFRNVAASSFSKHMYLESMSRLYLLYEPSSLLPFIRCVERFCPRIFLLSGHQPLARSHAERALTLFPPLEVFTDKVLRGKESKDGQAAKASLLAYVDLLSYCGHHSEACRALLQCHMYEESKQKLLLLLKDPHNEQNPGDDEQEEKARARATASTAVYFLLLEYCMKHRDADELKILLMLKPTHVDMLHVLRALRTAFSFSSNQQQQRGEGSCAGVTVGDLRSVLVALMQQRRIGVAN